MRILSTNRWHRGVWTLWTPIYNLLTRGFGAKRRRAIELADIQPREKVLLVGAGTGLDLDYIPRGAEITAIDITPAMLTRLRRRARRLGISVDARVMDGAAMAFPDESFDVVILHLILAVIPDPVGCAREAGRVLAHGGRAVIFDKFAPDQGPLPLFNRLLDPLGAIVGTRLTRKLGPLLTAGGLRIVHQEDALLNGLFKITLVRKD